MGILPAIIQLAFLLDYYKYCVIPGTHLGFHREPRWLETQSYFWLLLIAALAIVLIVKRLRRVYRIFLITILFSGLFAYVVSDQVIYRHYLNEIKMYDLYENGKYDAFVAQITRYDMRIQQEGMLGLRNPSFRLCVPETGFRSRTGMGPELDQ